MGVEVATFITDLQAANPGAGDLRSQGDDHMRLLKSVLQATFPTASKAWYNPTSASKTVDFTVVVADMNKTFLIDTTAGIVNMTLPTLVAGDAGWECFLLKTNTGTSPVLVKPPSGTLTSGAVSGLSAARRCIPGARISCLWTGSTFIISRAPGVGGPIGSAIDLHVATLPVGYEWPTGQTLASASTNYPEFNSVNGSGLTLDVRGRYSVPLDNLGGSAASRITTAGGAVDGATFGAVGGGQSVVLVTANLPPYTPAGTNATSTTVQQAPVGANLGINPGAASATAVWFGGSNQNLTAAAQIFTGTAQGGVSTAVKILPPTIIIAKVLVVE